MRRPDKFPQRNRQIIELRKRGVGPREIARRLKLTPQVVAGVLHRHDLTTEAKGRGVAPTPEYRAFAVRLLIIHGPAMACREIGVWASTLYRWKAICERDGLLERAA